MMNVANCPGSRCTKPQLPSIPAFFPPTIADGRKLGDTGCRGFDGKEGVVFDFVTEPLDAGGSDRSFRC